MVVPWAAKALDISGLVMRFGYTFDRCARNEKSTTLEADLRGIIREES